ncbi:unnamed protein product [Caenorhabditis angaria]|uniref:Uncharacterized protein n=1 Tax=Caenorhabditis angaria TaxID=860376 RepID=A0A9P1N6U3_9PELO|nr:unnamed protein product [Caenorhabditis angaria]
MEGVNSRSYFDYQERNLLLGNGYVILWMNLDEHRNCGKFIRQFFMSCHLRLFLPHLSILAIQRHYNTNKIFI